MFPRAVWMRVVLLLGLSLWLNLWMSLRMTPWWLPQTESGIMIRAY